MHVQDGWRQAVTLREFLAARGFPMDAAAILAGVNIATISRVASGKSRATPHTVLRLAKGFGMSARRMQAMCDASWDAAHGGGAAGAAGEVGPPSAVRLRAAAAAGL
jgi:plasmid maintenance system antidote protein VapI